jgi:hypothetical protein
MRPRTLVLRVAKAKTNLASESALQRWVPLVSVPAIARRRPAEKDAGADNPIQLSELPIVKRQSSLGLFVEFGLGVPGQTFVPPIFGPIDSIGIDSNHGLAELVLLEQRNRACHAEP